jgi:hypothetical protein
MTTLETESPSSVGLPKPISPVPGQRPAMAIVKNKAEKLQKTKSLEITDLVPSMNCKTHNP